MRLHGVAHLDLRDVAVAREAADRAVGEAQRDQEVVDADELAFERRGRRRRDDRGDRAAVAGRSGRAARVRRVVRLRRRRPTCSGVLADRRCGWRGP